jgi:hypothetical protein
MRCWLIKHYITTYGKAKLLALTVSPLDSGKRLARQPSPFFAHMKRALSAKWKGVCMKQTGLNVVVKEKISYPTRNQTPVIQSTGKGIN